MYQYQIVERGIYGFQVEIFIPGRPGIIAHRSNFKTEADADKWAEMTVCYLEDEARRFAEDEITKYYGIH